MKGVFNISIKARNPKENLCLPFSALVGNKNTGRHFKSKWFDIMISRDKKGLLKDNEQARTDETMKKDNNGHKEFEYNKNTGLITGKHSAVWTESGKKRAHLWRKIFLLYLYKTADVLGIGLWKLFGISTLNVPDSIYHWFTVISNL